MRTMATGVYMADQLIYMTRKSVPTENIHAAFWHSFCNDAQAMFSIQTTREQGLAYKGKSTDEGYGYPMPIYWVFKLLSEQRGDILVESHLQGDNLIAAPTAGPVPRSRLHLRTRLTLRIGFSEWNRRRVDTVPCSIEQRREPCGHGSPRCARHRGIRS